MFLPFGTFSPEIKLGLVSASRDCFPRELSERRTKRLLEASAAAGLSLVVPTGKCQIIETSDDALDAARQLKQAGCDAAVLFLGNFSPEIEDARFVKEFGGEVMVLAAAEESASTLARDRGDALCGLLSAALAMRKRGLTVHLPADPIVDERAGVAEIQRFIRITKVAKGIRSARIGLFGPRPRDFETCNYNLASLQSLGVEVEEFGFHDLVDEVEKVREKGALAEVEASMRGEVGAIPDDFIHRLSAYEVAVRTLREKLKLSGMTTQCWPKQEFALKHVPCYINARMAGRGFPVACENDAYSLVSELLGQYATDASVAILDINHSIPAGFHASLSAYPAQDIVGLFHCGNTDARRLKNPELKHQVIMKRLMEPEGPADITRGTLEGQIAASPITVLQIHGVGDRLRAYIAEGEFLDLDPKTFGSTGTAYIPGFRRFYRHVMLGRFHHHAAVAFAHCGDVLFDALKMLGVEEIYTPYPDSIPYPGENTFRSGFARPGKS